MRYVGIDLHKQFLVASVEDRRGRHVAQRRFDCQDLKAIRRLFETHRPLRAVIEASGS